METSAGLLLYRRMPEIEVFLGHFGGPYWQNTDAGAWTMPKGLIEDDEDPFDAALREFEEETGIAPPTDRDAYIELGTVKQSSSKQVAAWAVEADVDPDTLQSNTFTVEWPPNSGTEQTFPELDRAAYVDLETAAETIVAGQRPLLDRLRDAVGGDS
jgi:predicted NUDIX family NTP pyrophosphohydrolase